MDLDKSTENQEFDKNPIMSDNPLSQDSPAQKKDDGNLMRDNPFTWYQSEQEEEGKTAKVNDDEILLKDLFNLDEKSSVPEKDKSPVASAHKQQQINGNLSPTIQGTAQYTQYGSYPPEYQARNAYPPAGLPFPNHGTPIPPGYGQNMAPNYPQQVWSAQPQTGYHYPVQPPPPYSGYSGMPPGYPYYQNYNPQYPINPMYGMPQDPNYPAASPANWQNAGMPPAPNTAYTQQNFGNAYPLQPNASLPSIPPTAESGTILPSDGMFGTGIIPPVGEPGQYAQPEYPFFSDMSRQMMPMYPFAPPVRMKKVYTAEEKKEAKHRYSVVGWGLAAFFLIWIVMSNALYFVAASIVPGLLEQEWFGIVESYLCLYGIGLPICLLIMKSVPDMPVRRVTGPLSFGRFLMFLTTGYAATIILNLLSLWLNQFISQIIGKQVVNPIAESTNNSGLIASLFITVAVAPIMEEFVFRRMIFKKTGGYGPRLFALFSALTFALMHANFYQMFYAFVLGLIMSHICYRMGGNIWQCWLFHLLINGIAGMGQVVATISGGALVLYTVAIVFVILAGLVCGVILIVQNSRSKFDLPFADHIAEAPPFSFAFGTSGVIVYIVVLSIFTIIQLFL